MIVESLTPKTTVVSDPTKKNTIEVQVPLSLDTQSMDSPRAGRVRMSLTWNLKGLMGLENGVRKQDLKQG